MTHIFRTARYDHRHDAHKQVILNDNKPSGQLLFRQSAPAMETGKLVTSACAEALREDDLVHRACLGNAENAH